MAAGTLVLLAPGDGGGGSVVLWAPPPAVANLALWTACVALGSSAAVVIIPSLPDMLRGLEEGSPHHAALCALWNGAYSGGSALGPLLSAVIYSNAGWAAVVIAMGVSSVIAAVMLLSVSLIDQPRPSGNGVLE